MSELNCMNCRIGDFKNSLCDCDSSFYAKYKGIGTGQDFIDALTTKWIPCKERLPEVGRSVLLSVGKGLYTAEGELKHDGTWVQYRWSANIENVDAWAEMPEPWRG